MLIHPRTNLYDEVERLKRCCVSKKENWLPLPITGHELVWCCITTSGKRGEAVFATKELPPLTLGIDHHVVFSALDGVRQYMLALDDIETALILEPQPGSSVRILEASVNFWLDHEDPVEFLKPPPTGKPWEPKAGFNVRLSLGPS